jgi:hypothetical protein
VITHTHYLCLIKEVIWPQYVLHNIIQTFVQLYICKTWKVDTRLSENSLKKVKTFYQVGINCSNKNARGIQELFMKDKINAIFRKQHVIL